MLEVRERRCASGGRCYVHIVLNEDEFEHGEGGQLIASEKTLTTASGWRGGWRRIRYALVGKPIHSEHEEHERLTKTKALAIFSSDNISSSAYGPEEIMRVLALAGAGPGLTIPGRATIVTLAIVMMSYRQTIKAHPRRQQLYRRQRQPGRLADHCRPGLAHRLRRDRWGRLGRRGALMSILPALYDPRVVIGVLAVGVLWWATCAGSASRGPSS
jgi:hypothetical protein